MSDERTPPPSETSTERTSPSHIELSPSLKPSTHAGGRIVLYVAAFLVAAGYFFFRGARPASPQPVFLNADSVKSIEWPESKARLVSTDKGWRVEQETWGSAPADPGKVLELLQKMKDARGMPIPRVPNGFSPAGEMRVEKRTLRFYRMGADAVVQSGNQRYLLPGFSVDSLFPDPADLAQRRPLILDVPAIRELVLPVLTADGEKHYRIKKNVFYYITGTQNHLVNYNTILTILKSIQDVSFRRLLPPPPVFPEKADFIFSASQRTWRLARFPGSCPEGETAWVADSGEMLAGCIPERFMARLVPSLPTLLELRLLPSSPDGREWSRIRMRVGDREVVDVRKTPQGWVFSDGSLADDQLCEQILQVWQNTAILGLVNPEPGEISDRTVIVSSGDVEFSIELREAAGEWHALRGSEGRRARIPAALAAMVPPDRAGWADRRVFPGGCRQIARAAGAFREVFAMSVAPKEGSSSWRVLEPLDLPYPADLETWIQNLCSLRLQPAPTPEALPVPEEETASVRWEITDPNGKVTVLAVRPDGIAIRKAPDGSQACLKADEKSLQLLMAPWHEGIRPPWNLAQAKNIQIRLFPNREIRISFHDPHWLWVEGEKKRILTEVQAKAFLTAVQKALEQAAASDLLPAADCPVRLAFSSDAGLPLEYCVETVDGQKRVSRAGIPGHARVPEDFPEAQLPVFP